MVCSFSRIFRGQNREEEQFLGQEHAVLQVGRHPLIQHPRQSGGCGSDRVRFAVRESTALRRNDVQVSGPENPRYAQRYGELMIVIRRTFMGMPMDCRLEGVVMVMIF